MPSSSVRYTDTIRCVSFRAATLWLTLNSPCYPGLRLCSFPSHSLTLGFVNSVPLGLFFLDRCGLLPIESKTNCVDTIGMKTMACRVKKPLGLSEEIVTFNLVDGLERSSTSTTLQTAIVQKSGESTNNHRFDCEPEVSSARWAKEVSSCDCNGLAAEWSGKSCLKRPSDMRASTSSPTCSCALTRSM